MKRRTFLKRSLAMGGAITVALDPVRAAEPPPKRRFIMDAHCHAGRGMNYGKSGAAPWTTFNDPDWILRQAAEAGIDKSIVFPINNQTYEKANEEIARYVRQHPDRLIGFAKHDGKTEAGRIRQLLRREVKELGLRGLKLHGVPTPEMCETADELRIPILMHPPKVEACESVVQAYPQVHFVLAHLGSFASRDWEQHLAAIAAAKRHPNLYLETSSVVFHQYLEQAARELPAEKLIFGSDGPLVDPRVEVHKIRLLQLPPETEEKILSGNILRLLAGH